MKDTRASDSSSSSSSDPDRPAPGKRALAPVQLRAEPTAGPAAAGPAVAPYAGEDPFGVHLLAQQGLAQPAGALPNLDQIQASFGPGHDLSAVEAHVGGAAAEASAGMGATAYATGNHVAFAGAPDVHTAAHEAAHVVQQAQGVNLYGGVGEAGDTYERHADAVADRVVAGQSAADLLGPGGAGGAAAVQRKEDDVGGKVKKGKRGYARYGGGTVKATLTKLVEEGKLALTGPQIVLLDAVAQVETGGKIACVQTTDDQIVSVGFKQVVLGHGSLEKMMKKAPAGFAKHGLTLDTGKKYDHPGWSNKPHQIAGCEDENDLREPEWGDKFYQASMEPDVIAAMCELALGEFGKVEAAIKSAGGGDVEHFKDPTAAGWLLETYNNRPAFMSKAVKRAIAAGAKSAKERDAFLDILAAAIVETYVVEEPLLHYKKAKKRKGTLTADEDAKLMADSLAQYEKVGRHKGTNITKKISRSLGEVNVKAGSKAPAGPADEPAPAAEAAPVAAPSGPPADEQMMSLPAPEPEQMSLPEGEDAGVCLPEDGHPMTSEAAPAAPEPNQSIAPAVEPSAEVSAAPPAPVATAPEAAPAVESGWVVRARAYHRDHAQLVEEFNQATANANVLNGEVDPNMVARWQVDHGVKPDGRVGPQTVAAATRKADGPAAEAPAPAPNTPAAAPAAPVTPARPGLVTAADLDVAVAQAVPDAGHLAPEPGQDAPAPADREPEEAVPHDGLVQPHLEAQVQNVPVEDDEPETAPAQQAAPPAASSQTAYYRDATDATSKFDPKVKKLYEQCVALAAKGKLCFPGNEDLFPGASSAKFDEFTAAMYKQFDYGERRINKAILKAAKKGKIGGKAYQMAEYLTSIQADIPDAFYQGKPANKRLHHKALAAFLQMQKAAEADGVELIIAHGFRPPKNNGPSKRPKAIAGNSSHSYGLAMDIRLSMDAEHTDGGKKFGVTEISTKNMTNFMKYYQSGVTKWMIENARNFEFYPYFAEPWHYEYNPEGMAAEIVAGAKAHKK